MDGFDAWFSGFFDGEGSITCLAVVDKDFRRKIVLRASLSQHRHEMVLLEELRARYGGLVYHRMGSQRVAMFVLDGAARLARILVPLFDAYPLRTKKAREWELVRPVVLARAAQIGPDARYTTKGIGDDLWRLVIDVQAQLSELRGTWAHLHRDRREAIVSPRGRPVGVAETRPRRSRTIKADPSSTG